MMLSHLLPFQKRISGAALMLCAGMLLCCLPLSARSKSKGYDVFLLIGQSNMAGRGTLLPDDFQAHFDGIFLLDSLGKPVPASHPFNQYSTIRKSLNQQQMNPAPAFAERVAAATHRPVLLVVNARGGTGLNSWMPGSRYFSEALHRTRQALKYGTLKGILWHQGCTDGDKGTVNDYAERLETMVTALRDSLDPAGDGTRYPFIAGEVARWNSYAEPLNAQIRQATSQLPLAGWVSSEGCGMLRNADDPHFSREGQLLLGTRYAEKYLEIAASPRGRKGQRRRSR